MESLLESILLNKPNRGKMNGKINSGCNLKAKRFDYVVAKLLRYF